jgi:ribose transport system permease protein
LAGGASLLGRYGAGVLHTYGIVAALVVLVVIVSAANPNFVSGANLLNMLGQWAPAGIMAVGMTFVILTGGFDLSIATAYSLCAVIAAMVGQVADPAVAFIAAIAAGLVIGAVNGLLVSGVGINPFITTVGTGFMLNGVAYVLTGNAAYIVNNMAFTHLGAGRIGGLPYSGLIVIAFLVIGGFVLARTTYGQAIYAVGGNKEASRLSGLRVNLHIASAYVLQGFCVGVAGSITASQLASAQANIDPAIIFDVLTIVVVGGTSLGGGFGSMWRTAVGIAIIATITNGFVLLNINPFYQDIIKGAIIVIALALDVVSRRLAAHAGRGA